MMSNALKLFLIKKIAGQKLKAPWGVAISGTNFTGLLPEPSQGLSSHAGEILTPSVRTGPQQCQEVQGDLGGSRASPLPRGSAARENAKDAICQKPPVIPHV